MGERWKGGKVLSRGLGEAAVLLEYLSREDQGDIDCEASNKMGETHSDYLSLWVSEARIFFEPK